MSSALPRSDASARTPQRVLVAGASGVGKSTFARALSARWALPYTEIDALHWGDGWMPRPTFLDEAAAVAAAPSWVAEFQYGAIRPWRGIAKYRQIVAAAESDHPGLRVIRLHTSRSARRWLESTPRVHRQNSAHR